MLRRRPRRAAQSWVRHPAAGWVFLAGLYLTATVVNVLLAFGMAAWWPVLLAAVLALATVLCVLAALATFR
jgi:hypothetical protein